MSLLSFIAMTMTVLGVWLISEKILILGWVINGLADILWAYWGYKTKAKGWESLVFLQTILFLLALNGLRNA